MATPPGKMMWQFAFLLLLMAFITPTGAWAHIKAGETVGLLSGASHPVSGLDHVLAMIAVGIWGAQLRAPAVWLLPITFPMVMTMGALMGLLNIPLPGVEIGIACSAITLGILILIEKRPALWIAVCIIGIFAIFHGHAHGTELPEETSGLLYSLGFVVATGCIHCVGISIGLIHRWKAGQIMLRIAGGLIGAAGCVFLITQFVRTAS